MSENCLKITSDNFDEIIRQNDVVMVDFWASWCGPCKMLGPIIDQLAQECAGRALVGKVNVDEEQELAVRYGVMSIPTVILFKDGQEVNRVVGLQSKQALLSMLDRA